MEQHIYGVTELNLLVKQKLDSVSELRRVFVRGELSNYKIHPTGHHFFNLKDPDGVLSCIMYAQSAAGLRFRPENGMRVILQGRVSVFPRNGAYQLYCNSITPEGAGELALGLEQLKRQLYAEGLFDPAHKKPLPRFPEKIAVITAASGDAVRDIIQILKRRYPLAKVLVLSVHVQGDRAPAEIVGAIRYANRWRVADLIITGRGGGPAEDLWAFNDERIIRAIYESELPVISAVGHEPDETLADFAADVRAFTPSNAAELAVPNQVEVLRFLRDTGSWLEKQESARLAALRQRLDALASKRVLTDHMAYIQDCRMRLVHVQQRLGDLAGALVERKRFRFAALAAALDAMSPLKVLSRGYAMAQGSDGQILRSSRDTEPGADVKVTLGDGGFTCTVKSLFEKERPI